MFRPNNTQRCLNVVSFFVILAQAGLFIVFVLLFVKPRLSNQENQVTLAQKAFETTKKDITYGNPEWIGVQNMLSKWTEVQSDINNVI